MPDVIALFRTFVRVVEAGSFTAVATERNTTQPTISRQVALLEEHMGCLLLQRTTRSLNLTDDGRSLYDHATRVLEALNEAEASVGARKGKPSGVLRLSSAVTFGRLLIVPRLSRFMAQYPDVSIDLALNDGVSDLVEEGIDLAIRVGEVTDPTLIARRIGMMRLVIVAAPDYIARRGMPSTPEDLRDHDCVIYSRIARGSNWTFDTPQGPLSVPVKGRFVTNSTEALASAVINGLGIGFIATWAYRHENEAMHALVPMLEDWHPFPLPISAVYSTRRFLAPKVRAMIDFLGSEFESDPDLSAHPR
jgi:DNA-binding transcriptional LysR family regulator